MMAVMPDCRGTTIWGTHRSTQRPDMGIESRFGDFISAYARANTARIRQYRHEHTARVTALPSSRTSMVSPAQSTSIARPAQRRRTPTRSRRRT